MEEYQKRVVKEQKELAEKINKLTLFITSDKILTIEDYSRVLLNNQLEVMLTYNRILLDRISIFTKE